MFTIYALVGNRMELLYSPLLVDRGYAVSEATVDLEVNKSGSAHITIPSVNPRYDDILKMKTIIQIMQNNEEIFCGRVLHDEVDFYGNKSLELEGFLGFLIDSIMIPLPYAGDYKCNQTAGWYFRWCIDRYNEQHVGVENWKRFDTSHMIVSSSIDAAAVTFEEHEYTNGQDAIYEKLIDQIGGYLRLRWLGNDPVTGIPTHTIDYISEFNDQYSQCDQVIRFGENLLNFTDYVTADDTFTVLVPLGKMAEVEVTYTENGQQHKKTVSTERLNISGVNAQNPGMLYVTNAVSEQLYGNIWRTMVWDEIEDATVLYNTALQYLEEHRNLMNTLTIGAVDLNNIDVNVDKIKIGTNVLFSSIPHKTINRSILCMKASIDLLAPGNSEYTFESVQKGISDRQVSMATSLGNTQTQLNNLRIENTRLTSKVNNKINAYVDPEDEDNLVLTTEEETEEPEP